MSKFLFDSMLPKYTQFQPFISSQLSSSVASLHNNNNSSAANNHNNSSSTNNNNHNSALTTSTSEGSPLNSSEGSPSSPATSTVHSKMYPYVTNHSSSHSGLSGMPGFSSLDDKNQCRYVVLQCDPMQIRCVSHFKKNWKKYCFICLIYLHRRTAKPSESLEVSTTYNIVYGVDCFPCFLLFIMRSVSVHCCTTDFNNVNSRICASHSLKCTHKHTLSGCLSRFRFPLFGWCGVVIYLVIKAS